MQSEGDLYFSAGLVANAMYFLLTDSVAEWLMCQAAKSKDQSSIPTCGGKLHDSHKKLSSEVRNTISEVAKHISSTLRSNSRGPHQSIFGMIGTPGTNQLFFQP